MDDELRTAREKAERARAEADAIRRRLQALESITDPSLAHLDTERLLDQLLTRICDLLQADAATLLLEADEGHLRVRASVGLDGRVPDETLVELGKGVAGRIAATGEPLIVEDLSRVETVRPVLRERLSSLAGVPLRVGSRVVGVLHVGSAQEREFTAEDVELLRLVAERSAHAIERARLYDAALAASRAKSEFLANMSHELRTPINAVMGYTELLEMGVAGEPTERQRDYLRKIRSSNQHLLGLINEVLDLAKIESGHMTVAAERQPMHVPVADALDVTRTLAEEKGLELVQHCGEATDTVFIGDVHRVRQILINLLSNATKFTARGGRISVSCGVSDPPEREAELAGSALWAYIRVEDTGIGIAPERFEDIFHPFVQIDGTLTRSHGGSGLGLAISRRLARLMGGDLTVDSEPGRGSTFTLWLPAAHRSEEPQLEAPSDANLLAFIDRLQGCIDEILDVVSERLRADPLAPGARRLSVAELQDHQSTFLADIFQSLAGLDRAQAGPDLLRDGSEIQRVISDRHGAQRARLGWTEAALTREFELLLEAVEATARAEAGDSEELLQVVMPALRAQLRRAEELSLRGHRYMVASKSGPTR